MGKTNFDVVQANSLLGSVITEVSPFATMFYVDGSNGNDGNSGTTPSEAFASLASAVAATVSGRGDTIVIAPGTYTLTAALAPKAGNVFKAAVINHRAPSVIIASAIASTVTVDVANVKFIGIEFKATAAACTQLVMVADTASVAGLEFYFCTFNGADQTTVIGINAVDATFILTSMVVKFCLFRDLTGTSINIGAKGMAYSEIQYNQFAIDVDSGVAIALADTTAFATGKGYVIADNLFTGFDATANEVGITIAGTENTTGAGIIARNMFAYMAAAAVTIDKLSLSEVQNYYGDAATGGTLVDPGT